MLRGKKRRAMKAQRLEYAYTAGSVGVSMGCANDEAHTGAFLVHQVNADSNAIATTAYVEFEYSR